MKYEELTKAQRISKPPVGISKRLFSIPEASVYLGRSVWALREMIWSGKLKVIKDGRRILLDIKDMDDWIEKNKIQYAD